MSTDRELYEAIKLIKDMGPIIDPEEDFNTIVIAEQNNAIAEARRKKELEEAFMNLKALSKVLDAARTSSTRPSTVLSMEAHQSTMNELELSRLSLAKAVSDTERLVGSKEAEAAALKEEARSAESSDPSREHGKELDGTVLRLQIYKGLGFTPIIDKHGQQKLLIQSESLDLHSVPVKSGEHPVHRANHLWNLASS
ncbi:hypothetical protein ONZ45_g17868 [Pleurotus djamor]|nr:hypothetical protein ONZ45_g17868 [Pleurotus djamor]